MKRSRRSTRARATVLAAAALVAYSLFATRAEADDREWHRHRWWIGFTFGLTAPWHPSGNDVCAVGAQGGADNRWICAQSDGPRYPPPGTSPTAAEIAHVESGFASVGAEVMVASFEYAVTDGLLLGGRYGFYVHPTNVNVVFSLPSIAEVRATWVLGPHPLSRPGVRLYTLLGVGVGDFSARVPTGITTTDVNGPQEVSAWRVAGPWFVTTGIGVRIGTPRFAVMLAPLKFALPFGAGSAATLMPEITLMSSPF